MRRSVLALLLVVAACGGDGEFQPITVDVPATIVGELEITVEEGPVGDDDLSEVSFGSVTTDDGVVLIEVWADVVRSAGLTRDELVAGGRFQVELATLAEYAPADLPSYVVSGLSPDG